MMRSFVVFNSSLNRVIRSRRMGVQGTFCVWERLKMLTGSWWVNLKERDL
jgi:hypothetical protein